MKTLPFQKPSEVEFTNSNLHDFENKFNVKLPDQLVAFLKNQNGSTLENVWFLDKYYVRHFFPLCDSRYGSITQAMEFLISEDIDSKIPFAGDDDSTTYCIAVSQSDYGKVFRYQSCDWTPGESPLEQICDCFEAFINSFRQETQFEET